MPFRDRAVAGQRLAEALDGRALVQPIVLALPRGGVPVGFEVAQRLGAPLDVFVARKVGAPFQPEYGIGAIAEGGTVVFDRSALAMLGITGEDFDRLVDREREELGRRVRRYRGDRSLPALDERDVVLVDDGLATGVTAEAALHDLRGRGPRSIVLAAPVCAPDTRERLGAVADDIVCVEAPANFGGVGRWYDRFDQTTDDEVLALLARAGAVERTVRIAQAGGAEVDGDWTVPPRAAGVVVFAHGSGSSRRSSRNRRVAAHLNARGMATLLVDLLTEDEEAGDQRGGRLRFDIDLLTRRLDGAVEWVSAQPEATRLSVGLFGASTGAAAALRTAAEHPNRIAAVVSRGGRPDLAGNHLAAVRAPTLLIVGGADRDVLALNREAAARLGGLHRLDVVPGATHLFEEPGALDRVADLAAEWFTSHLRPAVTAR